MNRHAIIEKAVNLIQVLRQVVIIIHITRQRRQQLNQIVLKSLFFLIAPISTFYPFFLFGANVSN